MTAARITAAAVLLLAALLFVIAALGERDASIQASEARNPDLALRVAARLDADPLLRRQALVVDALGNTVILRGSAESAEALEAAIDSVRRIPGVREVRSEIRLNGDVASPAASSNP